MANIFELLKGYKTPYTVKSSRDFYPEEIELVKSAKVVASQYGTSVCFYMTNGCQKYIPTSRDTVCKIGDEVSITKCKLLTLGKEGEDDIIRVEF